MKIVSRPDTENHRRIAAIGMFDGVHKGHLTLIGYLMRQGERLGLVPTVVTFLNHPLKVVNPNLAPKRLTSNARRVELLARAGIRDVVMLDFNENLRGMSAEQFLGQLKRDYGVDALVVGFNNRFGKGRVDGIDQYKVIGDKLGMRILEAPEMRMDNGNKVSSSQIRTLLVNGDVTKAAHMLGYAYAFQAKVIAGQQVGRTLGFPTANLQLMDCEMQIPGTGVYVVDVEMPDGLKRRGVLNIGSRPTVVNNGNTSIEVHILDYDGWLYDDVLGVEFLTRLRDEKHFAGLDRLKRQIAADVTKARKV